MSERSITFRLSSETAKLYDEHRKKWIPEQVTDSLIIRAGLAFLMYMPEVASSGEMDKLLKKRAQIGEEVKERLQKNPDPQLYELWKRDKAISDQIEAAFEKSAEKYARIVSDSKRGRKPDPNKKHTPGRPPESEKAYNP